MDNAKTDANAAKRAAGEAAAALVESGMRLGLGTGSTTAYAIEALGRRVREEGLDIAGVPTSFAAERLARQHGVPLLSLDDLGLDTIAPEAHALDLAMDGADEVSPSFDLTKGRGAAQVREKVVAALAARFVVLIDPSKDVDRLGSRMPIPVEVLPMAEPAVSRSLRGLGAEPTLRMGQSKDGPVVTDQGLWVLDAHFADGIADPEPLATAIDGLPGVLGHGLFIGMTSDVLVGLPDGSVEHRTREEA
ncbi:ribose-5-phosphate isomerase RpiA [Rubricoccus marinus]|uniref:Ribose-5-phosphate isomerase A n=1 Tax=Rubricoccus marinus TaxID=716817 RepID=A0A259TXP3_9BACT|nr:ribose-5-phosphate isomerase RpiA [Rubricoccus marinus]OZC02519.1 ribose 5-phosphate isomerase A [Rubricoccus marinus]